MHQVSRRSFLKSTTALFLVLKKQTAPSVITVNGKIPAVAMGITLVHEHVLVDFIGADKINQNRWKRDVVVQKVLPYLTEVKKYGVKTIFDCTPAFLGRDVMLLKCLADESGLNIVTNTGYYGAVKNKYLPQWAVTETSEQLSKTWIDEFENGIDGSTIKPGFIKISVDADIPHLSELHRKLVSAAAFTHLQTGLTICSHTGLATAAFEEINILQQMHVHPSAFVWVHAQAEADRSLHIKAARMGAWVSLDGIGWGDFEKYATSINNLKQAGLLNRVLISHDAGWYKPDEKDGGNFTGFTNIFTQLVPLLTQKEFTQTDIEQLLVTNPAEAFGIRVRKM